MATEQLHDRVHAAMIEALLNYLPSNPSSILWPEQPYDWYGTRGSVDIVQLVRGDPEDTGRETNGLFLYEVYSSIARLEEVIRKLKEKTEYVPKYLQREKSRLLPHYFLTQGKLTLQAVQGSIVLLNTQENVRLIQSHIKTFQETFREGYVIGSSPNPYELDWMSYSSGVRLSVWLFDPIAEYEVKGESISRNENAKLDFERVDFVHAALQLCKYTDSQEFWQRWERWHSSKN